MFVLDDRPENAQPLRKVSDLVGQLLLHAYMDGLLEASVAVDDAERAVLRFHQGDGCFRDMTEHVLEFDVLYDGLVGAQKTSQSSLISEDEMGTIQYFPDRVIWVRSSPARYVEVIVGHHIPFRAPAGDDLTLKRRSGDLRLCASGDAGRSMV